MDMNTDGTVRAAVTVTDWGPTWPASGNDGDDEVDADGDWGAGPPLDAAPGSVAIPECRTAELRPTDPRMAGWRLYDSRRGDGRGMHHHHFVYTDKSLELRWTWGGPPPGSEFWVNRGVHGTLRRAWYPEQFVWENPVDGRLRFCEAAPLPRREDPWAADDARIAAEIKQRTACVCGGWIPCACNLPGWTYGDSFWTEQIKPIPERQRKLPAQYPMDTRWGRFKDRWRRLTHRRVEPVLAAIPDPIDDDEDWS